MSRLNVMPYEQFKKLNFNNYVGESINIELVRDLWGINWKAVTNERLINFKKSNNLAYLGEVLERYEERGIVKSKEDLRALLVYTDYSMYLEKPDMNTNQLEVFISKVEKESVLNKDVFSIGLLLRSGHFREHITDDRKLCSTIINELENSVLSFEEQVWGMYSCWKYLEDKAEFTSSENLLEKLDGTEEIKNNLLKIVSGIEIQPLKYMEDYYLYLMLAEMGNSEKFFQSSKNFKNKKVCNQYKKLVSLLKKEYKEDTIKSLVDVFNLDEKDLYMYNYLLSQNSHLSCVETKVTSKGEMRLLYKMLDRLSLAEPFPELAFTLITEKITEISEQRDSERSSSYYINSKGMKKAREIFFEEFSGEVSVENFDMFLRMSDIEDSCYDFFYNSLKYSYLFSSKYLECLKKVDSRNKRELAEIVISKSKDKEIVENAYQYIVESGCKNIMNYYHYKNMYKLGVLNANSNSKYKNIKELTGYFNYLKEVLSDEDFLKELKSFYDKFDEIEVLVEGYIGNSRFVSTYTRLILDILNETTYYDIYKDDNFELAKEYQMFKDSLKIISSDKLTSFRYIMSVLEEEGYRELMGLSEDDVKVVLRKIYHSIKEDSTLSGYSADVILRKLEGQILTQEEKQEKEIKEVLEYLNRYPSIPNIKNALGIDLAKPESDYVLKVKEVFLREISKEETFYRYSSVSNVFEIARKFSDLKVFDDEDLLKLSKSCLMYA